MRGGQKPGTADVEARLWFLYGPFNCWPRGRNFGAENFNFKLSHMKNNLLKTHLCGCS